MTAIAIPEHAQTSVVLAACSGPPQVTVAVAPKCTGNPPVGTAVLEVTVPDDIEMELIGITFTVEVPKSDLADFYCVLVALA